jgi:hypothetical protein
MRLGSRSTRPHKGLTSPMSGARDMFLAIRAEKKRRRASEAASDSIPPTTSSEIRETDAPTTQRMHIEHTEGSVMIGQHALDCRA